MAEDTPMHTINLCHAQQAAGLHMLLFVFNPPMDKNACICWFHATKQEVYTVQSVLYMLLQVGQVALR